MGDPDASAGRREGLQAVLADEAEALEKINRQAYEAKGFDTVKVQLEGF
jgi:hypothetical protein